MPRPDDYKHGFTDARTAHAVAARVGCRAYRVGDVWRLTTPKKAALKQRYSRAEQKRITEKIIAKAVAL